MANRLANEKSPYLLQHAHNPVDWYPWGEEAFDSARAGDKPIFLSIGYSTCHWCHVMERESFEDEATAALMNRHFVNIKVDREERPDVDRVYMSYVQASTGSGGWPLSVWLTPDLQPFYGGTYFPPDNRYGRPGFPAMLTRIAEIWETQRAEVTRAAENITAQLRAANATPSAQTVDSSLAYKLFKTFEQSFDKKNGGFGNAPKFPRASNFNFLLRYFAQTGDQEAARMVLLTLFAMAYGGMYDHLGGGFHRYSVDEFWHVPHFEKMLYDQAQLASVYLDACQLTQRDFFARVARETLDYVLRDLTDPSTGGFYSAEDADSLAAPGAAEKAEGAFYVWTAGEIDRVLGAEAPAASGAPNAGDLFRHYYGIQPDGNADDPHGELTGQNVLHVVSTPEETAEKFGVSQEQVTEALNRARLKLVAVRNARPRPHLDDKIVTAWNGLMLSALARGWEVLGERRYLDAAVRAASFLRDKLWNEADRTLWRRYRQGEVAFEGYAEDYAMLAQGFLDLYEASFQVEWLLLAEKMTARSIELFWDETGGGFYSTSGRDASVLIRMKEDYDGAEPSANSVAAINLVRLGEILNRPQWNVMADRTVAAFADTLNRAPQAMPRMVVSLMSRSHPPAQIVIAGEAEEAQPLLDVMRSAYLPNKVVLLANRQLHAALDASVPWLAGMTPRDGKPAAFVCQNYTCTTPVTTTEALAGELTRLTARYPG